MPDIKPMKTIMNNPPKKRFLPRALRTKYKLNEQAFKDFDSTLREYQKEAVQSLEGKNIGQINIPPGTGKTYIQKHVLVEDMIRKEKKGETGVYVIAAHLLILCTQLFNEILHLTIGCGVKADMVFLGSERYDFSKLDDEFRHTGFAIANINGDRTTSGKKVAGYVNRARREGKHTLIVSTYHSFHRLAELDHIDICTFDEAHTTVSDRFTDNISAVKEKISRQFFFTATRRVIGEEGGQNDTDFYGEVVYEMSPRKAMELGVIVRPFVHEIMIEGNVNEDGKIDKDLTIKTVKEAFIVAERKIKRDSYDYLAINGKMLVTVDGLESLHEICDDPGFQKWCTDNSIRVFAFSSDQGEFVDFKECGRQRALEHMNSLKDTEKAILFHYDILTEGIDLPAITSVLLLRSLPPIKLLQNIGRGARLLKPDRSRVFSGEIGPNDYDKMVKPYCLITVPHYTNKEHTGVVDVIHSLRTEYDIPIEFIVREDVAMSVQDEIAGRVTETDTPAGRITPALKHYIEDISKEFSFKMKTYAQGRLPFVEHYLRK